AETDIVVSDPTTGEIEIYEVKSGTKAKREYLIDLAFQCHVAEQSGFHVRKAFLITVDSSYVFDEVLEADKLLSITDATDDVAAKKDEVADGIKAALGRIQNEPIPALVDYCKKNKLEC